MIQTLAGYINFILSFFYNLVNNYGLAIIMLSILVNLITFPLTRKQLQASKKMQDIQPELKKIQEKYKHDKEKANQATMEYMRENKINPLGGCLPLLVQFPIIIAVFQLLREPEMIRQTVTNFSPFFLFWDLTEADPMYILPILAAAATFFHQRLIITDPKQKIMLYVFPVMIMVISVSFPAGLVLYWFTNSLFSVGNHYLMKKTESKKEVSGTADKNKKPEKGKERQKEQEEKGKSDQKQAVVSADKTTTSNQKVSDQSPKKKKKKKKGKKKGAGNIK